MVLLRAGAFRVACCFQTGVKAPVQINLVDIQAYSAQMTQRLGLNSQKKGKNLYFVAEAVPSKACQLYP